MTETVGNAIATRDNTPSGMIATYQDSFAAVLPSHVKPATFVRLAQGTLRRDKYLAKVATQNPASLMTALLECARKGLEPGTEEFYLVPFGNEVTGITGYQGHIELIYRAGAVASVKAEVVREGDHFHYEPATMDRPDHKVDWFEDRGDLKGVYSYAVMKDGSTSRVIVLNRKQIAAIKRESKGSDKPSSPWQKWEEAMWLKSAVKQLQKWVPTSAEYRREQLRAAAEIHAAGLGQPVASQVPQVQTEVGPVDGGTGEVLEAELLDPDAQAADQAWLAGGQA
jgi:recombination protein RecT